MPEYKTPKKGAVARLRELYWERKKTNSQSSSSDFAERNKKESRNND